VDDQPLQLLHKSGFVSLSSPPNTRPVVLMFAHQSHGIYMQGPGALAEPFEQDVPGNPGLVGQVPMHQNTVASKRMESIVMACFALTRAH
jgi:hypothetical protein